MIQPYFEKDDITIYHGDLLDVLPQLPEASVDCVVTDPPYGLRFMEKGWDHDVPGPAYWQAIARVCKPGALLLAFGGTRTYHRLTCAIEDAGWEIRDCLMWLHGQGFPKSLDISKAIDKAAGAVREVIGASRSIDCVERGYTKVYSTKAENSGFGTSRTFGSGHTNHRSCHAGGREVERLGHGVEASLGADRPGDEALGWHVRTQCGEAWRSGHEYRRQPDWNR